MPDNDVSEPDLEEIGRHLDSVADDFHAAADAARAGDSEAIAENLNAGMEGVSAALSALGVDPDSV